MLLKLHLKNLVLIESCEIPFGRGLNILSGETGAGKTALIEAIGLALGQRADSSTIRSGEDKAIVEAIFSLEDVPKAVALLEEAGIDFDKTEPLKIRREITKEGKNRALINHQPVPLPLLQSLSIHLIDLIGQHSSQLLKSQENHRMLLDLFGDLQDLVKAFNTAWAHEKKAQELQEELLKAKTLKEKDSASLQKELSELKSINLSEEEALFQEYERLINSQENKEKILSLCNDVNNALPFIKRAKIGLDALSQDPSLQESLTLVQEAFVFMQEASHLLGSYNYRLEVSPERLQILEEKLKTLSHIKRKYGSSTEEIEQYKGSLQNTLKKWENLDFELENAEIELKGAQQKTKTLCTELHTKRKASAKSLSRLLTSTLCSLNMEGSELTIEVCSDKRTSTGEDSVNFWLKANKGESSLPIKANASGGELSRLLLALKLTLSEKNETPTLIFDEIDANVGGKTADLIGEKLKELSKCRQILCITHFPQVASKADEHYRIYKEEEEGRTFTRIEPLKAKERQKELLRMLGGKELITS